MSKKKATPFHVFIQVFFRTMGILLLMLLVGFISYYITLSYYRANEIPVDDNVKEKVLDIVSDAKVTEVAKNLICITDKQGKEIKHMFLEVFNTNTSNLDYITLPIDNDITLSNDLYQRLYAANEEVPQVIKLSHLNKYFEKSTVFEYAEIIVGELLDTEISFYTIMPQSQFKDIFRIKKGLTDGSTCEIISYQKKFWKICRSLSTTEEISDYIEKVYEEGMASNISLKNRKKYADAYMKLQKSKVHFYPAFIKKDDRGTFFDEEATANMLAGILKGSDRYYKKWNRDAKLANAEPSFDKNIYIANGANITGLASTYREILTNAGYNITGIGNYDGDILTNTKILVKEEATGYDLLSYFQDAEIEIAELSEGMDIEIILGTKDAAG